MPSVRSLGADIVTAPGIDRARWHYALGIHSNIPRCCVEFFVLDYLEHPEDKGITLGVDEPYPHLRAAGDLKYRFRYIPCPVCLAKAQAGDPPAAIHKCNSEDPLCRMFVTLEE